MHTIAIAQQGPIGGDDDLAPQETASARRWLGCKRDKTHQRLASAGDQPILLIDDGPMSAR